MTSSPFREFLKYTKPGPAEPCAGCGTYALRLYVEPGSQEEKVVCTNFRCLDSPLYRTE
jgi:hypothetical protein